MQGPRVLGAGAAGKELEAARERSNKFDRLPWLLHASSYLHEVEEVEVKVEDCKGRWRKVGEGGEVEGPGGRWSVHQEPE